MSNTKETSADRALVEAISAAISATASHDAYNRDFAEGWHAAVASLRGRVQDILARDPDFEVARFVAACQPRNQ